MMTSHSMVPDRFNTNVAVTSTHAGMSCGWGYLATFHSSGWSVPAPAIAWR